MSKKVIKGWVWSCVEAKEVFVRDAIHEEWVMDVGVWLTKKIFLAENRKDIEWHEPPKRVTITIKVDD